MNTEHTEMTLAESQQMEAARILLVAAAQYAACVTMAHSEEHPEFAAALPPGAEFSVRVTGILGARPRVALTVAVGGVEREIGHSELLRIRDTLGATN